MSKLHAPLYKLLEEPISELQVQRIWRQAQSPLAPTWKHKRLQLTAAGCVLVLATLVSLLLR
jgi:hypothetical protein